MISGFDLVAHVQSLFANNRRTVNRHSIGAFFVLEPGFLSVEQKAHVLSTESLIGKGPRVVINAAYREGFVFFDLDALVFRFALECDTNFDRCIRHVEFLMSLLEPAFYQRAY